MRLSDVLARRGVLAPPEVVTLVVGLALDLAELQASGGWHGAIGVGAVWFEPDGRPRLTRPAASGDPGADVSALALLGLRLLGDRRPAALVAALDADSRDARDLAERVLASGPAAPVRLGRPETAAVEPAPATSAKWRVLLGVAVVLVVGAIGWPRGHEAEGWRDVLAKLDRARTAAITHRSVAELRAVYAAGSAQLARDEALIGSLVRDHLILRGRLAELTDPAVAGRATLAAVERPADYDLADAHGRVVLRVHGGSPRRVVVRLRLTAAGWRVVDVS